MDFKKILNMTIKVVLPLVIGCLLFWFLYRGTDFGELWTLLKRGVRYDILLFSLVFGLAANIVRAVRWGLLIDTLGEHYKMKNLVFAVLGNYAVNLVFPRMGEVWRCGIITKYEKISFTKLLGTLLIDRVADAISVGLILVGIVCFNAGFFKTFLANNPSLMISFPDYWIIILFLIIVAAVWYTFTRLKHLTFVQKSIGVLSNVWEGMKSVWLMEHKGLFIIETVMIWGLYFIYFYTTFYAFGFTEHLGVRVGLIAFTMSSIGVAVPIQGGLGPWHFMVINTLIVFSVSGADAKNFAFVVFAVQTLWQALCGIFGIAALSITNKAVDK
ncbi:dolichol-P-glucose synthetase [Bacteroidia bacterium]|nr:dolichol-P-glucose synthetase [Bacteroidia bacterium]